jgi:hypothetical protein
MFGLDDLVQCLKANPEACAEVWDALCETECAGLVSRRWYVGEQTARKEAEARAEKFAAEREEKPAQGRREDERERGEPALTCRACGKPLVGEEQRIVVPPWICTCEACAGYPPRSRDGIAPDPAVAKALIELQDTWGIDGEQAEHVAEVLNDVYNAAYLSAATQTHAWRRLTADPESCPAEGDTVVLLDEDNQELRLAEWPPLVADHGWTHWQPVPWQEPP